MLFSKLLLFLSEAIIRITMGVALRQNVERFARFGSTLTFS